MIPIPIIPNKKIRFTSNFWQFLEDPFGTTPPIIFGPMVRIREQFKHRKICPNRVWLILEMVGLTICYKSDSLTTIAIPRSQGQHQLKHNTPKHEKQTRDTLDPSRFILEFAGRLSDLSFHHSLASHVYLTSHFKPQWVPAQWTTRSILHSIPLEEIQLDHMLNMVEKQHHHLFTNTTSETNID